MRNLQRPGRSPVVATEAMIATSPPSRQPGRYRHSEIRRQCRRRGDRRLRHTLRYRTRDDRHRRRLFLRSSPQTALLNQ